MEAIETGSETRRNLTHPGEATHHNYDHIPMHTGRTRSENHLRLPMNIRDTIMESNITRTQKKAGLDVLPYHII